MSRRRPSVRVVERKLGRERAFGQEVGGLVEIDPRLRARSYLNTLVHELLHAAFPGLAESRVRRVAYLLSSRIWSARFRRLAP